MNQNMSTHGWCGHQPVGKSKKWLYPSDRLGQFIAYFGAHYFLIIKISKLRVLSTTLNFLMFDVKLILVKTNLKFVAKM